MGPHPKIVTPRPAADGHQKRTGLHVRFDPILSWKNLEFFSQQFPGPAQHPVCHSFDGLARGIQNPGVLCRPQRRDRSLGIPPVTVLYVPRKGGKANINTLVIQLLMSPQSTFLSACCQEHLEAGIREHVGAHVAAVSDQSRRLAEAPLQCQKRVTHRLQGGDRGRALARLLRA